MGEMEIIGLMPWGSNYTYHARVRAGEQTADVVYKPRAGEAPLYDFPTGTLYKRECAAFIMSEWLGLHLVPLTLARDGPIGVGSVQLFVQAASQPHMYSLTRRDIPALREVMLFDMVVNNADRKPGHCFKGEAGRLWAIDHGLTFHSRPKLRTVIWEFCGEPIPEYLVERLRTAACEDESRARLEAELSPLISAREVGALFARIDAILREPVFPELDPRYNIPYGFA